MIAHATILGKFKILDLLFSHAQMIMRKLSQASLQKLFHDDLHTAFSRSEMQRSGIELAWLNGSVHAQMIMRKLSQASLLGICELPSRQHTGDAFGRLIGTRSSV